MRYIQKSNGYDGVMKWVNYNHLYYFWTVAREGGVVRASEELMVSQPTISNQLRELESAMGQKLFERRQRVATDGGGACGVQLRQ